MNKWINGSLRYNATNPRYFTDDSGKSIYLAGSHTWAVMQDMWLEPQPRKNMGYDAFLQMLVDHGHNFLRYWQWMQTKHAAWSETPILFDPQPYARTGPGTANDGEPKFDLSKWNEPYFFRLRERVRQAGDRGIYVAIMLFEGWSIKNSSTAQESSWGYCPMNPANNINSITDDVTIRNGRPWNFFSMNCPQILQWQKAYVKKVIETVNDLDNVLYEICNEMPHTKEALEWQTHICDYVHEVERSMPRQHPVGITPEGTCQDTEELYATNADWISPSCGPVFEYRCNPPAADGRKVIINDTDHIWGHGGEVAWIWKNFTRGINVIFMDPWEPIAGGNQRKSWLDRNVSKNSRYYYAWDPLRRNLGYTVELARRMDLNACIPRNELCTSTYCLANPGYEYVIFLPAGGTEGVDLRGEKCTYEIEWLNPHTGITTNGGGITEEEWRNTVPEMTVVGGKRYLIHAPFEGPAVLYLRRREITG